MKTMPMVASGCRIGDRMVLASASGSGARSFISTRTGFSGGGALGFPASGFGVSGFVLSSPP